MKKVIFLFLAVVLASCSANKQQTNYTASNQKDAIAEFNEFSNNNSIYFGFDSSKIEEKSLIEKYKEKMNKLGNNNVKYVVSGMCDDRGSDEYNNKLGLKRANAVKQALGGKFNITTRSDGKRKFKKYSNDFEINNQANRKAVVVAVKVKAR